jgi:HEPN domain-containing protein
MKEFEKWFKKAESDLLVIQNNLNSEKTPADACCFHSQQAAEKYLKAYLVSKQISFPKTHALEILVKICCEQNNIFSELYFYTRRLSSYSVTPRYPDMLDDLTIEDAKEAYQNAIAIKEFILKNFFE